jgi:hypothetical protein
MTEYRLWLGRASGDPEVEQSPEAIAGAVLSAEVDDAIWAFVEAHRKSNG